MKYFEQKTIVPCLMLEEPLEQLIETFKKIIEENKDKYPDGILLERDIYESQYYSVVGLIPIDRPKDKELDFIDKQIFMQATERYKKLKNGQNE